MAAFGSARIGSAPETNKGLGRGPTLVIEGSIPSKEGPKILRVVHVCVIRLSI